MTLIITEEGRACTCCNQFKSWEAFYKQNDGVNGRMSKCILCRKAAKKEEFITSMKKEVETEIFSLNWDLVTRYMKYGLLA